METGADRFNAMSTIMKVAVCLLGIGMLFHTIGFFTPYYTSYSYFRYDPRTRATYEESANEGLWLSCSFRTAGLIAYMSGCSVPLFRTRKCVRSSAIHLKSRR